MAVNHCTLYQERPGGSQQQRNNRFRRAHPETRPQEHVSHIHCAVRAAGRICDIIKFGCARLHPPATTVLRLNACIRYEFGRVSYRTVHYKLAAYVDGIVDPELVVGTIFVFLLTILAGESLSKLKGGLYGGDGVLNPSNIQIGKLVSFMYRRKLKYRVHF